MSEQATTNQNQSLLDFKEAAMPLVKYLCENHHPHVKAIITSTSIELLEGQMIDSQILDHLVD